MADAGERQLTLLLTGLVAGSPRRVNALATSGGKSAGARRSSMRRAPRWQSTPRGPDWRDDRIPDDMRGLIAAVHSNSHWTSRFLGLIAGTQSFEDFFAPASI
jgi:hypothetical protein